jgi:putative endonuclease
MPSLQDLRIKALERCVSVVDWVARKSGRVDERAEHLQTGERGEEAAFFFLRRNGFTVVAQRWNDGPLPGDLDLIAWQGDILCFIEVKTRTSRDVATASAAVDRNKRKILRRLAGQYLRQLPNSEDFAARPATRFDIVTVYELPGKPREITLIPAAFGWSERS